MTTETPITYAGKNINDNMIVDTPIVELCEATTIRNSNTLQ